MKRKKEILTKIKRKMMIFGMTICTLMGAFFVESSVVNASSGNYGVEVVIPTGWQTKSATCQVKPVEYAISDKAGKEVKITADKVAVSFDKGEYTDITDVMVINIANNGLVNVQVTYSNGDIYTEKYEVENFDLEKPTIKATVDGELLYLTATDEISGVKDIVINNQEFSKLTEGTMCTNIKDLEATEEYISVYSRDIAGNTSPIYKINNPYYVGTIESGATDQSLVNPDSVEATDPTKARGTVSENVVNTDGGEITKEFYTITANEKTFYLVVDKTQNQENVYLLTEAGTNDLLNFVDYNGVDVENGNVPMYEIADGGDGIQSEDTEVEYSEVGDLEETATEKTVGKTAKNSNSMMVIVVVVCIFAIGFYFVKNKKKKDYLSEAEEMDTFDVPEEEDEELIFEDFDDDSSEEKEEGVNKIDIMEEDDR